MVLSMSTETVLQYLKLYHPRKLKRNCKRLHKNTQNAIINGEG